MVVGVEVSGPTKAHLWARDLSWAQTLTWHSCVLPMHFTFIGLIIILLGDKMPYLQDQLDPLKHSHGGSILPVPGFASFKLPKMNFHEPETSLAHSPGTHRDGWSPVWFLHRQKMFNIFIAIQTWRYQPNSYESLMWEESCFPHRDWIPLPFPWLCQLQYLHLILGLWCC